MLDSTQQTNTEHVTPSEPKHSSLSNGNSAAAAAQEKYVEERNKRIRSDGASQFVDLYDHPKFAHFKADPWLKDDTP